MQKNVLCVAAENNKNNGDHRGREEINRVQSLYIFWLYFDWYEE